MLDLRLSSISIVLPCYNEEANVENTTKKALAAAAKYAVDWQVIVVDDGGKDRTGEIADRLAAEDPHVTVVHNRPNRGYGGAVRAGFDAAVKEYVFFTDGDGQFDMDEIGLLLPLLKDADIAAGYRLNRQEGFIRKLNAWAYGQCLVPLALGIRVKDLDCAFKLFHRRVLDSMTLESTGALINAEFMAKAKKFGFHWKQIGVHHLPRQAGNPTGAKLSVIMRMFKELFKLRGKILRAQPRGK
ncbi:MAG: glycosyltransferase family 2 protein [Candidatus Brocadiia bacterium]